MYILEGLGGSWLGHNPHNSVGCRGLEKGDSLRYMIERRRGRQDEVS